MEENSFTLIVRGSAGELQERTVSIKARLNCNKGHGDCKHTHVEVDESLWSVECQDCGEKLDPIQYLVQLAKEENFVRYRVEELKEEHKRIMEVLEKKTRTRCEHCGKYTRIGGTW
jgi:DNA-directed RNA polymerase subunit RPC12/RpoP